MTQGGGVTIPNADLYPCIFLWKRLLRYWHSVISPGLLWEEALDPYSHFIWTNLSFDNLYSFNCAWISVSLYVLMTQPKIVIPFLLSKISESQARAGTSQSHESCESRESQESCEWSLGHAEQLLFSCLCSNVTGWVKVAMLFSDSIIIITLPCGITVHRAGSQLKTSTFTLLRHTG